MNTKERLYFEFAKEIQKEGRTVDQYLEAIDSVIEVLGKYTKIERIGESGPYIVHMNHDLEFKGICDTVYHDLVPGVGYWWFNELISIKTKILGTILTVYWCPVNKEDSITRRIEYLNEIKEDLIYYFKPRVMSIDTKMCIVEGLYEIAHQSPLDKHIKILLREWYSQNELTLEAYLFLLSIFKKCGFVSDINNLLMIHRLQLALIFNSANDLTISVGGLTEFFMYYKNSLGLHHISRSDISRIIESTLR